MDAAAAAATDSPTVLVAILFLIYHTWLLHKIKMLEPTERQLTSALDPVGAGSPMQPVPANCTCLSSASQRTVGENKESALMGTESAQENPSVEDHSDSQDKAEGFGQQRIRRISKRKRRPTWKAWDNSCR
jgi:hypothetical protein